MPSIVAATHLLIAAGSGSAVARLAVLKALLNLMKAAADAGRARGDIYHARGVEIAVRRHLATVAQRLESAGAAAVGGQEPPPAPWTGVWA